MSPRLPAPLRRTAITSLRASLRSMLTRLAITSLRASLRSMLTRLGLNAFRRLPLWIRRRAIHAGTPNFTVGAVLLLRDDDDQVLLVRQRHTNGWSLPGGLLGHGETPEDAVTREVFEELGMRIDQAGLSRAVPHALINPQTRRVDVVFTLTSGADIEADGVEILEARWFAPDAPPRCTRGAYLVLTRCGVVPGSP